jgi:uncharacterized protein (TIGR02596 family)
MMFPSFSLLCSMKKHCRQTTAFSLVELLVVMALISMLAVATVPALRGTLDGVTLSGAAGLVESEFSLARQTAMSRNLPVEVRFYQHDDGTGKAWRVLASVIPASASGQLADEWISRGKVLPGSVVADDTQEYSTVLSLAAPTNSSHSAGPWSDTESTTAPVLLKGKSYVGFQFRPDGTMNLPNGQPWCVTVRGNKSQPVVGAPAVNYISIVLDALTGRTISYQP